MNVVFRCDSAPFIGAGHVLRCLSLALYLTSKGCTCMFICRIFESNLIQLIRKHGFSVHELPYFSSTIIEYSDRSSWLGSDCMTDASQTIDILKDIKCDYLVVDHYGIDFNWENLVTSYTKYLVVIDDLANRIHKCDALIDPNYYHDMNSRYDKLVPPSTLLCLGPAYALVRPQFKFLRSRSLSRREKSSSLTNILVSLGGSDPDNLTQEILSSLPNAWSNSCNINVVIGSLYPHLSSLRRHLVDFSYIKLFRQTEKMHSLMYYADLAITAGGSITWEKFTLGLPSIAIPSDIYETDLSLELSKVGAQISLVPSVSNFRDILCSQLNQLSPKNTRQMSRISASLCNGNGVAAVYDKIILNQVP